MSIRQDLSGWQGIRNAPKNGTFILTRAGYYRPCVAHWATYGGRARWGSDPEGFMEEDHFLQYWLSIDYEPTHWMPLPDEGYQDRVEEAHYALFHDDPTDVTERCARFFEEANETCQAFGMTRHEAHQLVDYTYDRPIGEPAKEVGAAMLTLTSLCVVADLNLFGCAEADLEKLQRPETIARIRAKRSTRHGRWPLPGYDPEVSSTDAAETRK